MTGAAGMRSDAQPSHLPVMFQQAMDGLDVRRDGRYLDGTFGRGGHARGLLDRLGPDGRLLVMDKDPEAIAVADALASADARVAVRRGSFADLARWNETAAGLDGVFMDLGVSSPQLDVAERGFSFMHDGPLDMRMGDQGETCAELIARMPENELADVIYQFGDERFSRPIARELKARLPQTTFAAVDDVKRAVPRA